MATVSYSQRWAPMNFDGDVQMSNASTILDQEEDSDFLIMEIEIPASANASVHLSLDDPRRKSLSMFNIISDNDYAPPQSPAPQKQQAPFNFVSHRVTPHQKNEEIQLPDSAELQMQYQNTIKKLAKSMRRSDATRSVIKRQRKFSPSLSFESDDETDFFTSPRCQQLEQSRKRLFRVINRDA
jgi:hypothetical protein